MRSPLHLLKPACAAALLAFAPAPAFAEEPPAPLDALTKQELMDRVSGKVVVYLDAEGLPYGEEYFDPNGREVVWRYMDGSCQSASWTARGTLFCFAYPDSTSCWRVKGEAGSAGEWTAHLVTPAEDRGLWVRMAAVESRKLRCGPDLTSQAAP